MPGKTITLLDDTQWPKSGFDFTLPIRRESAALGVIDVQGYVLDADGHLVRTIAEGQVSMLAAMQLLRGSVFESQENWPLAARCYTAALTADALCYEALDRVRAESAA